MINGITSIIYALVGITFLTIQTTAELHQLFIIPGLIMLAIAGIKAIIGLISALSGKINVSKLCFSLSSILISIYGITNFVK